MARMFKSNYYERMKTDSKRPKSQEMSSSRRPKRAPSRSSSRAKKNGVKGVGIVSDTNVNEQMEAVDGEALNVSGFVNTGQRAQTA